MHAFLPSTRTFCARLALRAFVLLCVAMMGRPVEAANPVASAARVEETGGQARLMFDFNSAIAAEAYVMAGPDRVIIDLPEVNFQLEPRTGQIDAPQKGRKPASASKLISSFRFGLFAPGKSRIVIDLGRPALVVKTAVVARPEGGHQLQIDVVETDPAVFQMAARSAASEVVARDILTDAPQKPAGKGGRANLPVVVIDPGHGGIDVGAQGVTNVIEKDIVFEFSKTLKAQLEVGGRYRVILTRNSDVFVPLAGRVKIAREAGADLFISIHADTLSESGGVSGATVYTVSDQASDKEAARLAEKENLADAAAGLEGIEDANDVSDILFDLTRRETRTYSHVFARTLVDFWNDAGRLNKNPHRSAGFRVLKAPDVPSVLLELGYLSSAKDTAALMKPEWRIKASQAIVRAVDAFFVPQAGRALAAPR